MVAPSPSSTPRADAGEYVQDFDYLYTQFDPPFTPERYIEAIEAAIAAGAKAIVVDSATHEWEGEGGVLDAVNEYVMDKGEQHRMRAWATNKPKHRALVYYAARGKVHTIFCFRAREKVKVHPGGKVEPKGWQPCTNEEANYEFRLFAMLDPVKEGVPMAHEAHKSIKYLKDFWKPGQQITPQLAAKIASWANGVKKASPAPAKPSGHTDTENGSPRSEGAAVAQQMGIQHDPPPWVEDDPDDLELTDEEAVQRARHLYSQITRAQTRDKISDLDAMVMDLKERIPADNFAKLTEHLQAKSTEILKAEKAA